MGRNTAFQIKLSLNGNLSRNSRVNLLRKIQNGNRSPLKIMRRLPTRQMNWEKCYRPKMDFETNTLWKLNIPLKQ